MRVASRFPRPSVSGPHAPPTTRSAASCAATGAAAAGVTVVFRAPDGRTASVASYPGAPLLDAANEAAALVDCDIVVGCCSGSCGVCEVELARRGAADGGPDGAPAVVRACITAVPAGYATVEVSPMPDDAVWGVDAWDT